MFGTILYSNQAVDVVMGYLFLVQHAVPKFNSDSINPLDSTPPLCFVILAASRAAKEAALQLQSAVNLTTPTVPKQNPSKPPQNSPAAPATATSAAITAMLQRSILRKNGCRCGKAAAKMLSCGINFNVKDARGFADCIPAWTPALKPLMPLCVPAAMPPSIIQKRHALNASSGL